MEQYPQHLTFKNNMQVASGALTKHTKRRRKRVKRRRRSLRHKRNSLLNKTLKKYLGMGGDVAPDTPPDSSSTIPANVDAPVQDAAPVQDGAEVNATIGTDPIMTPQASVAEAEEPQPSPESFSVAEAEEPNTPMDTFKEIDELGKDNDEPVADFIENPDGGPSHNEIVKSIHDDDDGLGEEAAASAPQNDEQTEVIEEAVLSNPEVSDSFHELMKKIIHFVSQELKYPIGMARPSSSPSDSDSSSSDSDVEPANAEVDDEVQPAASSSTSDPSFTTPNLPVPGAMQTNPDGFNAAVLGLANISQPKAEPSPLLAPPDNAAVAPAASAPIPSEIPYSSSSNKFELNGWDSQKA